MPIANKREIVNEAGTQAVNVDAGVLRTTPGANQPTTARAKKLCIVDPITGSIATVTGGALSTSGG